MSTYYQILKWTMVLSQAAVLFPLVVVILRRHHYRNYLRWAARMILVDSGMAVIMYYCWWFQKENLMLLHGYVFVQFFFWWMIYRYQFILKSFKFIHLISGMAFLLLALVASLFIHPIHTNPALSRSIEGLWIIFYGLLYSFELFRSLRIKKPESHPMFWLNAGALVYFSGSLFLFIFSNYILAESQMVKIEAYALHGVFIVFYYSLLGTGLCLKQTPSPSH